MARFFAFVLLVILGGATSQYITPYANPLTTASSFSLPFIGGFQYAFPAVAPATFIHPAVPGPVAPALPAPFAPAPPALAGPLPAPFAPAPPALAGPLPAPFAPAPPAFAGPPPAPVAPAVPAGPASGPIIRA